jgi:hypothetical protein
MKYLVIGLLLLSGCRSAVEERPVASYGHTVRLSDRDMAIVNALVYSRLDFNEPRNIYFDVDKK